MSLENRYLFSRENKTWSLSLRYSFIQLNLNLMFIDINLINVTNPTNSTIPRISMKNGPQIGLDNSAMVNSKENTIFLLSKSHFSEFTFSSIIRPV